MDKVNPTYDLVTHNNGINYTDFFPLKQLWGYKGSNLNHINKITMDKTPHISKTSNHLTRDVCTYPFNPHSLNRVYMERPPTLNDNGDESHLTKAINNLAKGMCHGAPIEIELHPFSLTNTALDKALINHRWPLFNNINNDPFTAQTDRNLIFMAFDIVCNGMQIAMQKKAAHNWFPPQQFIDHAKTLSKTIEELLTFYEKQGLGSKELLKKHLNREMYIIELFIKQPQLMFLHNGPKSGPEKFLSKDDSKIQALPLTQPNALEASRLLSQRVRPDGKRVYTEKEFVTESFANFILCDAFVTLTQDNIKNFMKKSGFFCPTVERKTSPHNGRKNVWIVSAFKLLSAQQVVALGILQQVYQCKNISTIGAIQKIFTAGILQYVHTVSKFQPA